MAQKVTTQGMRTFFVLWFGQVISMAGSGLTGFALGVWVYQKTGSATQFAFISFATLVPSILLSPLAGALVDRWDRQKAMIWSDVGSGLCTAALAFLFWQGRLEIWHIYVLMAVSSAFNAVQGPAYEASITLLVPRKNLGRASGLVRMGMAAAQIVPPMAAGFLIEVIGVAGCMLVDFGTFLFAMVTLLVIRIPRAERTEAGKKAQGSLFSEAWAGWRYLTDRRGLLALLILFAVVNFTTGTVRVLFTPLVLSFASAATLGVVLSVAGFGMLAGGIAMSIWGGPPKKMHGIVGALLFYGVILAVGGLRSDTVLVGAAGFLLMATVPIVTGCSQVIWQTKVAPDLQGRVFAIRRMVGFSTLPLAYAAAGPLTDYVFEPLMAPGGALAASLGGIIGTGQGRGIGLFFILLGASVVVSTLVFYQYRPLRRVEAELPDVTTEGGTPSPAGSAAAGIEEAPASA